MLRFIGQPRSISVKCGKLLIALRPVFFRSPGKTRAIGRHGDLQPAIQFEQIALDPYTNLVIEQTSGCISIFAGKLAKHSNMKAKQCVN
jgi:hypothetical protein